MRVRARRGLIPRHPDACRPTRPIHVGRWRRPQHPKGSQVTVVLYYPIEGRLIMATTAPIKVDVETDRLVSNAAHFLKRSKKDVVEAAVREYIDAHRDEIQNGALEALRSLDGSARSAVKLLADATDDEIESLGGLNK